MVLIIKIKHNRILVVIRLLIAKYAKDLLLGQLVIYYVALYDNPNYAKYCERDK